MHTVHANFMCMCVQVYVENRNPCWVSSSIALHFIIFLIYIYVNECFALHVCMCTTSMSSGLRGPKVSDLLELEFQLDVNYHVGTRN